MRPIFASMVFGALISLGAAACTTGKTPDASHVTEPLKVTVPPGTYMTVELQNAIGTDKSSPGDLFSGNLAKDVVVDGLTVFVKGSVVYGRVEAVQEPGPAQGLAQLKLKLTSVKRNGVDIPIQTQMYVGIAHNSKKNDTESRDNNQVSYPPETRLLFTIASPVAI